jgi:hypothetical protein
MRGGCVRRGLRVLRVGGRGVIGRFVRGGVSGAMGLSIGVRFVG